MLHPDLQRTSSIDDLRARWRADPCLRIEPFLDDAVATSVLHHLRAQAFTLMASVSVNLSFQYWNFALQPDEACDHVLCKFGRFLWTDGVDWVSAVTGLELGPPLDRLLTSSLYSKGCYLDAHNDYDGSRQVAFIIGLTRNPIPVHDGGGLEFLQPVGDVEGGDGVRVTEIRSPGWNTLDIFDVRRPHRLHRVPLVTEYVERRAISGWFYGVPSDGSDRHV